MKTDTTVIQEVTVEQASKIANKQQKIRAIVYTLQFLTNLVSIFTIYQLLLVGLDSEGSWHFKPIYEMSIHCLLLLTNVL